MYTVSTEAVFPSRKFTVCSSPCTNINNMSISTSAKLHRKAMKTSKHPGRKVLKIANVNIFFNLSLSESVIPTCFKQTTIVPVSKNTKVTYLNDYP